MYSLISENQYCVEGRSINECNCKIRDTLYYLGTNNKTGAVINIDWEKAFDRVNWDFLIKVMRKMRFLVLVNGHFTQSYDINRVVRQGCHLSMILFIIFQKPCI